MNNFRDQKAGNKFESNFANKGIQYTKNLGYNIDDILMIYFFEKMSLLFFLMRTGVACPNVL